MALLVKRWSLLLPLVRKPVSGARLRRAKASRAAVEAGLKTLYQ